MSQLNTQPVRILLMVVAALTTALIAQTSALATSAVRVGGPTRSVIIVTTDESPNTTSSTFVDVPQLTAKVTVPSGEQALLLITVSGGSACTYDEYANTMAPRCFMRILVDKSEATPGAVAFAPITRNGVSESAPVRGSQSMQWFAGPINAGNHVVRVQYRAEGHNTGVRFWLFKASMSILRSRV